MEITQPLFPAIMQQSQPQSRREITQDFPSLGAFLASCQCGEEEEKILRKHKITLKRLPNFQEQDFKKMGIALGAARDLDLALMKYRLNPHYPNENQVCVDCIDCVDYVQCVDR